jgi:hypothetical protein
MSVTFILMKTSSCSAKVRTPNTRKPRVMIGRSATRRVSYQLAASATAAAAI